MKAWKQSKRQRRRRWPWRHGNWMRKGFLDGNEAKLTATWYRRHGRAARAAIRSIEAALNRHAAQAEAEGRLLPLWHPACVLLCFGSDCRYHYDDGQVRCGCPMMDGPGAFSFTTEAGKAHQVCPYVRLNPPRWTEGLRWHHDRSKALVPVL